MADEVVKLQKHLSLLREEYVKLQSRFAEVEKKYQVLLTTAGQTDGETFVSRLLKIVADLFDKELYSDLTVKLDGQSLKAHRFVLAARSNNWGVPDLGQTTELDLSNVPYDVGHGLMKWVYTDDINIKAEDEFLLQLLKAARKYELLPLSDRCENALMSSVNMKNSIKFYQTAEEIGAEILKQHCSEIISAHWNDFSSEDFASMTAPLAYRMFKSKSEYVLHTAIRIHREDVVFLYLVEHDAQLPGKLNEIDSKGDLPLDLALQGHLEGIANTLIKHKVDVNRVDHSGKCLLHKAINRRDEYAAKFLINNNANVNASTSLERETALHLVASISPNDSSPETLSEMASIAKLLLEKGANINAQDSKENTALHRAIQSKNEPVFLVLLGEMDINLELQNLDAYTALWLALQDQPPEGEYSDTSFASRLLKQGSSPNALNKETGDTLLHLAASSGNEAASLFLANNGGNGSATNMKGETPLHIACEKGLAKLAEVLLNKGANPNAQTNRPLNSIPGSEDEEVSRQTPLHLAIANSHKNVVEVFLSHKAKVTGGQDNLKIIPNFTIKDSKDQTALGLALWQGFHDIAIQLISGGVDINDMNSEGFTLLHQAIEKQDSASAIFLINHQADVNAKTGDGQTCLQQAIKRHLPTVVSALCQAGANMNIRDENGDAALWTALDSGQQEIASILVSHGCNTDMWGEGPEQCQQTLLHRAIDENNEDVACFLIRSQCDVNCPRKPGPNGEGGEESRDGQTPLHLSAAWCLEKIVQCLLEQNADINIQDAEGKTPLHVAIENQAHVTISLLLSHPNLNLGLKDKYGLTPFAAAMNTKNNKAAQAILDREPTAAEQVDNKGRNFLHTAIQKGDIESVLFLISVHADVNSRVQDSSKLTPLHLAVKTGSEMIVRNLILAGSNINELTPQKQTCLHLAAAGDQSVIASVLIENGIDFDAIDDNYNNALHLSVQHGHLNTVRVLLTESQINAETINMRGQNPLHILGQYGKENAAAMFELFKECMPEYPVDRPDANGNTALLLAYMNGNGNLCRAIVRSGAQLGLLNKDGLSIFNAPVATKQLLLKLLDMLSKEPPWNEGDNCLECGTKFGIKTRKHHCRHCGRLLCAKCSEKDLPILKYNITKPTRVCDICFDVLTHGAALLGSS